MLANCPYCKGERRPNVEDSYPESRGWLSRGELIRIIIVYSLIGLVTILGFLLSTVVGRLSVLLAGLGIVTYAFGLRHGLDADHIANLVLSRTCRRLFSSSSATSVQTSMAYSSSAAF